jgi:hypothetical protein
VDAGRQWALRMFGEAGPRIRARIPTIVAEEHEKSAAAQEAWGHEAQFVYGNIWHGLLKTFEQQLGSLPGATTMRPGEAPYRVPVINRTTLFAWRYGRSTEREMAATPFATSPARAALPDLFQRTVQQTLSDEFAPDLDLTEEDRRVLEVLEAVKAQPQSTNRLVVVAIASSFHGLHRSLWGEMTITQDGYPQFTGFTEDLLDIRTGPASLDSTSTFTDGAMPDRKPEIIADEDDASDEDV